MVQQKPENKDKIFPIPVNPNLDKWKFVANKGYKTIMEKEKKSYIYNASDFMFQFMLFYASSAMKSSLQYSGFQGLREISGWEDESFIILI